MFRKKSRAVKNNKVLFLGLTVFFFFLQEINAFQSPLRTIKCSSTNAIKNAMENAKPGDEIVITAGTYTPSGKYNIKRHITLGARFYSSKNGTAQNPIIIRGEKASNRPTLKGPSNDYDGYVFLLEGNHWIIKDLKMKSGSKGLILDNANNVTIDNIEVSDIGSEGIHVRDGSSNTLIKNCYLHDLGIKNPSNGEGIYTGSDVKEHNGNFNPYCNNVTITNCQFGPNISAEAIDIKEETDGTKIYNNRFNATGIVGDSRNDAFIDIKGINAYVYNNKFFVNTGGINAGIDIVQKDPKNDQSPIKKTGYRIAVFKNEFFLGANSATIPIIRFKGGDPYDIHMWDNSRNPNTPEPDSYFSDEITYSCPSWSVISCNGTGGGGGNPTPTPTPTPTGGPEGYTFSANEGDTVQVSGTVNIAYGANGKFKYRNNVNSNTPCTNGVFGDPIPGVEKKCYIKTVATPNPTPTPTPTPTPSPSNCSFDTPQNSSLSTLKTKYENVSVLGNGGPDASNLKKFTIDWNAPNKGLYSFAFNTKSGKPSYYVDLKKNAQNLGGANPGITIKNSGISGLDGAYWVTTNGSDFVLVSKTKSYSIYCSNSSATPNCNTGAKYNANSVTSFVLSPNPASDVIQISSTSEVQITATIYDMQGKRVQQQVLQTATNKLDVSTLQKGMYIITLIGSEVYESQLISIK